MLIVVISAKRDKNFYPYFHVKHFIVELYVGYAQDNKYPILFLILSRLLNIFMGRKGRNEHIGTH